MWFCVDLFFCCFTKMFDVCFYLLHIFTLVAGCYATRFGVEILDDLFDVLCLILIEVSLKLVFLISFLFWSWIWICFKKSFFSFCWYFMCQLTKRNKNHCTWFYRKKENEDKMWDLLSRMPQKKLFWELSYGELEKEYFQIRAKTLRQFF